MKTTTVLEELEQAASQLGFVIRKEKGNFRGGVCSVDGEAIIMLNKRHIPDVQLVVLADSLRDAPIDTIYLKPAVRDALEEAWDQLDAREAARAGENDASNGTSSSDAASPAPANGEVANSEAANGEAADSDVSSSDASETGASEAESSKAASPEAEAPTGEETQGVPHAG